MLRVAGRVIAMEDLTCICRRIKAGPRARMRSHRRAFRQDFIAYQAGGSGLATVFTDPACTSKACSQCGRIGSLMTHRFVCGRPARSDVNAALNHARRGESALTPRADIKGPYVEETGNHVGF
jgi:transposase